MKIKFRTKKIEMFNLILGLIIDIIQFFNIKSINTMALFGIGTLLILSAIISFGIRKFQEHDLILRYRKFTNTWDLSQRQFKPELHSQFSDNELIELIRLKEITFHELEYQSPYQS